MHEYKMEEFHESLQANASSNSDSLPKELDDSIWYLVIYYAIIIWAILFTIYWVGKYIHAQLIILNIGSNASAYQRVSQVEYEDDSIHRSSTGRNKMKHLFPSDEDLQLWEMEMIEMENNRTTLNSSIGIRPNNEDGEYGLKTSLEDEIVQVKNSNLDLTDF